jgi:glycosyltransferase involved in cell wall biosynthesis
MAETASRSPKIAIVHEWFAAYAGSERVVEQMLQVWPQAELFALCDFLPDDQRSFLKERKVTTSFIQRLPFARKKFRGYLPLMPLAIEQFDLDRFDMIVSSSHCVAHGVLTRADQLHVSYVHSPIRYAWDLHHQYLRQSGFQRGLRSFIARAILHYMRLWDRLSADRVDAFIANSHYVADRVRKTYRRPCRVVYPPVDVGRFALKEAKEPFFLTASRLVPYKRVDAIVEAFQHLPHQRLVVIGDGPDLPRIKKLAGSNVELLGYQPTAVLEDRMQRAQAFLFAADEDFGITSVEAQACGTPVIAYGVGGSRETVRDGVTGLLFEQQTPASIAQAVNEFLKRETAFDARAIRRHAETFSTESFLASLQQTVDEAWKGHQRDQQVR